MDLENNTTCLLVDLSNLAHRSYHADLANSRRNDPSSGDDDGRLRGPHGKLTGVSHGCLRTILRLREEFSPNHIIAVFDDGRPQARMEVLPEYKGNRPPREESLHSQINDLFENLPRFGISVAKQTNTEADDIIFSLAKSLQYDRIIIVGDDKDLGHCVTDHVYQLKSPCTSAGEWRLYGATEIASSFKVPAYLIPDYLALIGDASDNIPGIPGVGPKYAAQWIQTYGGIEDIIANCDLLKPERFRDVIRNNVELLRKCHQVTRPIDVAIHPPVPPAEDIKLVCDYLNMHGFLALAKKYRYVRTGTGDFPPRPPTQCFLF